MPFQVDTAGTLDTNLEAYWKLDEASGIRFDAVGSHDLSDNNTVTQAGGIIGSAADFLAVNSEFLNEIDTAGLSAGDIDFAFSCWVRLTSLSTRVILAKGDSTALSNFEYALTIDGGSVRFRFTVSPTGSAGAAVFVTASSFGLPPLNTFVFITCWHDATANTINIQVNNGAVDSTAHSLGVFDGTEDFRIGADQTGGGSFVFDGRIDEVGRWNKVLSAQERTDLYNGGSGNAFTSSTLQTITSDTSLFGTTTQTIESDSVVVLEFSKLIGADSTIILQPVQTITADTSLFGTTTQTIDSDTGISGTTTQGIASNTLIIEEVEQTIGSDTNIIVQGAELKMFTESDLITEVGTAANPIDFSSIEAGLTVEHPDNAFVLFNDKGGSLGSVDAKDIQLSVLELNIVDELLGTSSGGASQTFIVAFPPVDQADDVIVKVNDVEWLTVSSFAGAAPTDEIYTFDFLTGTITFGDGFQGKIPPVGNTIKASYTPDTILRGKEVSEQLWIGVQSNGIIANPVSVDRERVTPPDINSCQTLRSPILSVTGVFLNSDPNKLGTNFFTSGSFDVETGVVTLGTSLPDTSDVLIDYTYQVDDDNEPTFVQIGRTTKSAVLNPIPSNNGKKLNFRIAVPSSASPSSPQTVRFKLRVEYKQ